MRRWWTAATLGGVVALVLTGCAPGDVDGKLTDDWAKLTEPKAFVPEAATCHPRFQEVGSLSSYEPVDCAEPHEVETVHLGTFTGAAAELSSPPATGSDGFKAAFSECDKKATELVGADWRSGRLILAVVLPSARAWSGGARWFRCDLGEVKSLDDDEIVSRTGSLKDALSEGSPLAYTCFNPKLSSDKEYVDEMIPVACNKAHSSEFVGVYVAPDTSYDAFTKNSEKTHNECLKIVAKYAGVPNDDNLPYRSGTITYSPTEAEWDSGNRGVQCFMWLDGKTLTKSVKNGGSAALPIN